MGRYEGLIDWRDLIRVFSADQKKKLTGPSEKFSGGPVNFLRFPCINQKLTGPPEKVF